VRGLVIVPAFNEEASIATTLKDLKKYQDHWDILVVNDGSSDATAEEARKMKVRLLSLPFNLGIGTAVQSGYLLACREDYDWACQFDADGQHQARYIEKLRRTLFETGSACVVGSRYLEKGFQNSIFRRLGALYFSILLKFMGCKEANDPSSGFRICDRRAIALFAHNYPLDYPEIEARLMLKKRFLPLKEVPVEMSERREGKSSIGNLDALFYVLRVTLSLLIGKGR
jgi:glycosyltransferase involved in cell wall biosynthesis